jgi:hypothetical protein
VIIMASIDELIDFLANLMRDDNASREFARDPDAALADRGLADVTGQDVRDARLMMADCGSAQPRADRPVHGGGSGADPVREIHYTTTHFEVGDVITTVISVEDNDTVIVDSFNTDVTAIQDNDTTDIDVISIEDNDTVAGDEDPPAGPGEEGAESGVVEGAIPDSGAGPADDPLDDADLPSGDLPSGELPEGSESELIGEPDGAGSVGDDQPDTDSGADEGFAPDPDSGFGTQPELSAEAGPSDEPFDELAG